MLHAQVLTRWREGGEGTKLVIYLGSLLEILCQIHGVVKIQFPMAVGQLSLLSGQLLVTWNSFSGGFAMAPFLAETILGC